MMVITYGDVGGESRAAAERELLVHELQVERVLGGEGRHEAEPLAERHPDVRSKLWKLDKMIISHATWNMQMAQQDGTPEIQLWFRAPV